MRASRRWPFALTLALVVLDGDLIVPGSTRVFLFETSDALEHLVVALDGYGLVLKPRCSLVERRLETLGEEVVDATFPCSRAQWSGSTVLPRRCPR